ncbi:hypothetical protein SAMD00019534_059460 [Acytostelium subglobosum LB1]|uniref:hypothetical protein n=1 Tax=Acytostelium subglobosum LB1 TaxID=1410327 RepID=UPI000644F369|nr:hypothetical protein SAMD00019534_059460 [Acytostelium subglobosum LB1]GAM22771.1 hypothetical protein SAMD00019534_059460 [Acytostelium subglobosum LB1]|eukprot:XP_012753998.1 hypothetical protein SAMD00019534_059460 [Acytostelium subglobosum LB1]
MFYDKDCTVQVPVTFDSLIDTSKSSVYVRATNIAPSAPIVSQVGQTLDYQFDQLFAKDEPGSNTIFNPPLGWSKVFLPDLKVETSIFIRDSYIKMKNLILSSPDFTILITGNPGIGKSFMLIYLLFILAKSTTRTLVLHSSHINGVLLFTYNPATKKRDVTKYAEAIQIESILMDPATIYLIDSVHYDQQIKCKSSGLMVSSPNPEKYKEYLKRDLNKQKYWMNPWSIDEVNIVKILFDQSQHNAIDTNFLRWGGIPRYVFSKSTDTKELDDAICQVKGDDYVHTKIKFGSKYIKDSVATGLIKTNRSAIINFIRQASSIQSSLGGAFFEILSHLELVNPDKSFTNRPLCTFPVTLELLDNADNTVVATTETDTIGMFTFKDLKQAGPFKIRYPSRNITFFGTHYATKPKETSRYYLFSMGFHQLKCDPIKFITVEERDFDKVEMITPDTYSKPSIDNFPCVDSIIKRTAPARSIFFQMTLSKDHPTNLATFSDLVKGFTPVDLYFVVPSSKYHIFKYQDTYHHKDVNQYILEMSLEDMGFSPDPHHKKAKSNKDG